MKATKIDSQNFNRYLDFRQEIIGIPVGTLRGSGAEPLRDLKGSTEEVKIKNATRRSNREWTARDIDEYLRGPAGYATISYKNGGEGFFNGQPTPNTMRELREYGEVTRDDHPVYLVHRTSIDLEPELSTYDIWLFTR